MHTALVCLGSSNKIFRPGCVINNRRDFSSMQLTCLFAFFFFLRQFSCSSDGCSAHYVAKADPELWILLPLFPQAGITVVSYHLHLTSHRMGILIQSASRLLPGNGSLPPKRCSSLWQGVLGFSLEPPLRGPSRPTHRVLSCDLMVLQHPSYHTATSGEWDFIDLEEGKHEGISGLLGLL